MPYQEAEDRAWMLTQIGHLQLVRQRPAEAERALDQALELFPDYHYALGALAEVRTAQRPSPRGGAPAAAALRRRAASREPVRAGRGPGASRHDRRGGAELRAVRGRARREMGGQDNANRELVSYLVGAGKKPAEGSQWPSRRSPAAQDVYTREAYAWALFKNGKRAEARKEIAAVLAVGIQHPRVLERAALIQGKPAKATAAAALIRAALARP